MIGNYLDLDLEFWKRMKADFPANLVAVAAGTYASLNGKQKLCQDLVMRHFHAYQEHRPPPQLLLSIDGKGGTGKTYLIMILSEALETVASAIGHTTSPIIRAAPTGVAAHNISGRTLHSLFRLTPKARQYEKLSKQAAQAIQAAFKGVQYIVIDEKSMVGLKLLAWIDRRCKEIWPDRSDLPFGGLNVILAGDFFQLPPVGEKPLFTGQNNISKNIDESHGHRLYQGFFRTIELDVVVRQQGPEEAMFRNALEDLRTGNVTVDNWRLLATRVASTLSPSDVQSFQGTLHVYAKKADVIQFNHTQMRESGRPVVLMIATNEGKDAASATTEQAGNLQNILPISIGCRVMLTENIWTERGLVNGTMGNVRDMAWEADVEDPRKSPPTALLVAFDSYNGPSFREVNGEKLVPIFRSRRDFVHGSVACLRTQFPLVLAYAITIHKSQGMTLEKAVLNIADKRDFAPGLTYVAVSRVKSLKGVLFEESFDLPRLRMQKTATTQARNDDVARRAFYHVASSDPQQFAVGFMPPPLRRV